MVGFRPRRKLLEDEAAGGGSCGELTVVLDEEDLETEVKKLRGRWELASVLNFLTVFEPVIGKSLKISAEEIETGLVKPDASLAQLHIALLEGIPPASKTLKDSNTWVTALCKKLAMWWPWVAKGKIPIVSAKGGETLKYKELDPASRLLILKALCEIRADQNDAKAYVNDSLKRGTHVSCFRKEKIGRDGEGISYICDGSINVGYRLYREVISCDPATKIKAKGSVTLPNINFQWETLATNLKEFRNIADEFSSSKNFCKFTVAKTIETDAIPVLEKLQKKKERMLKRKEREEKLLSFRKTIVTRSCRNRQPVNYTFADYDRAIADAIHLSKKSRTAEEQKQRSCDEAEKANAFGSKEATDACMNPGDEPGEKCASGKTSGRIDILLQFSSENDTEDDDYVEGNKESSGVNGSDSCNSEAGRNHESLQAHKHTGKVRKPAGARWSKRLNPDTSHPATETRNLVTKNRLRQRPTLNSALDSLIVPDSEDELVSRELP